MDKQEITIALYQQDIRSDLPEENRNRCRAFLENSDQELDIIVAPETFSCGFGDSMALMAEEPDGPTMQFAAAMANRFDALFVATWPIRDGGKVYNRMHWVRPDGTYGFYDKAHTFRVSGESAIIEGGRERRVFEWRGWRIKPAVCYDLRFPKWLRNGVRVEERWKLPDDNVLLCAKDMDVGLDYDLMIVCANWPGTRFEAWRTLLKARAIENLSYVVGVNRVGVDNVGIEYTGNSAVVDFKGLSIVECEAKKEQLITAKIDKESLMTFRRHWPFYLDFD